MWFFLITSQLIVIQNVHTYSLTLSIWWKTKEVICWIVRNLCTLHLGLVISISNVQMDTLHGVIYIRNRTSTQMCKAIGQKLQTLHPGLNHGLLLLLRLPWYEWIFRHSEMVDNSKFQIMVFYPNQLAFVKGDEIKDFDPRTSWLINFSKMIMNLIWQVNFKVSQINEAFHNTDR